jgi:hypothetical protein
VAVMLLCGSVLPNLLWISSSPPVILPVPSAVMLPTMAMLSESKPLTRNAYWPLSSDSLPEPAPQAAPLAVVTVIVTLADFVVSATEVAVSVTTGTAGTTEGAVYVVGAPLAVPAGLSVPQSGEQATPFWVRVQVTPLLVTSFVMVAVNCGVLATTTLVAELGVTEMEITGTVTVAEAFFVGSSTEAAMSVTEGDTSTFAGPV